LQDLIFKLCKAGGVSGNEENIAKTISGELSDVAEVFVDKHFNNVTAKIGKKNSPRKILMDAHLDNIGMLVTTIENGFLRVSMLSKLDRRILPGSKLKIFGNKIIEGIVSSVPPHLSKKGQELRELEEIVVDVAMKKEGVEKIIPLGSYVGFSGEPQALVSGKIASPSLDNKIGVAVLIETAKILSKKKLNLELNFLFSSREESGGYVGATIGSWSIKPTEAIVVDVTFANQPGVLAGESSLISKGPSIGFAPNLSKKIFKNLKFVAKKNKIPHQIEVMSNATHTNADTICTNQKGVPTGLISIPIRNMHSIFEVADLEDIKNTVKLLTKYISEV
jgi:endoglucanase